MPGQVRLVHLHDVGVQVAHLLGQGVGQGMGHLGGVPVMLVDQRLGQHVRAGDGELEGVPGQRLGPCAGQGQVQAAAADGAHHRAGRPGAELHAGARAVGDQVIEGETLRDPVHGPHEVLDHPVGLGVIDVEAVKLAVAHHIHACLLLRADHHPRGVHQGLLRWCCDEPVGHGVRADDGGLDTGHGEPRRVNCTVMTNGRRPGSPSQFPPPPFTRSPADRGLVLLDEARGPAYINSPNGELRRLFEAQEAPKIPKEPSRAPKTPTCRHVPPCAATG